MNFSCYELNEIIFFPHAPPEQPSGLTIAVWIFFFRGSLQNKPNHAGKLLGIPVGTAKQRKQAMIKVLFPVCLCNFKTEGIIGN
jgi:hypothetical protein